MGQLMVESKCAHCGLLFFGRGETLFCCAGCQFVYNFLQSKSLTQFYDLRKTSSETCPLPVQSSISNYTFLDDPEVVKKLGTDENRIRLYLDGLTCTACIWLLEKLPDYCPAAESARVDLSTSIIEVYRKPNGSFAAIAQTLNQLGYIPHLLKDNESALSLQRSENKRDLIRIGTAGLLTGNIMIFSVSLYAGATGDLGRQFQWLTGLLALPVLSYCAWPFYRNAFVSLKNRRFNIDVPIVIAVFAGIVTSLWELRGHAGNSQGHVYFDSLSMLVFLLLSSRYALKKIQSKNFQSTNMEDEMFLCEVQRILENGKTEKTSAATLLKGDLILIQGDSFIPADGTITSGSGSISTAVLTGESDPQPVITGSMIEAGSQNKSGTWTLRVANPPTQTRLAQILRDTEKASQNKSAFVRFSDRVSHWFVGLVLTASVALLFIFWNVDLHEGISRALALIIVTCPCVFGIAIPLSMNFAIRAASRKGIVIKNADAIERLWKTKALYFDKTGTLTTGEMVVLQMTYQNLGVLRIAAGLEEEQPHPVGRAISKHLRNLGMSPTKFGNVVALDEGGIQGELNGLTYSLKPVPHQNANPTSNLINSTYSLFHQDEILATFQLGDQIRQEAPDLVRWIRKNNYGLRMISGDRQEVALACGTHLGFSPNEIQGRASPEQKATEIRKSLVPVAMIGDGANDASALAHASVGIAMKGSIDMSLRAADIYLTSPNLTAVSSLFGISKLTRFAIYRNLFFSAAFNLVSGTLAAMGLMTPLWAAVLMPASSLIILLSATWTGRRLSKNG